jgi:hypothetical protein
LACGPWFCGASPWPPIENFLIVGNAAAREDALALARDLKHGAVMPGWNWTGWFVAIVD